jgi:hypothetical protein
VTLGYVSLRRAKLDLKLLTAIDRNRVSWAGRLKRLVRVTDSELPNCYIGSRIDSNLEILSHGYKKKLHKKGELHGAGNSDS